MAPSGESAYDCNRKAGSAWSALYCGWCRRSAGGSRVRDCPGPSVGRHVSLRTPARLELPPPPHGDPEWETTMLTLAMVTSFPVALGHVFGGVEAACLNLVEGLAVRRDVNVHVLSVGRDGPGVEHWDRPRCIVHRLPRQRPAFLTYWNVDRRRIEAYLRGIGPDLVHVHAWAGWLGPGAPWPRLLTIHGLEEKTLEHEPGLRSFLKRQVIARVERRARGRYPWIIAISRYGLDQVRQQVAAEVRFIDNAVESAFFNLERSERPGRLLYIGRIKYTKNVHGLVEMARELKGRGYEFDLVLAGPAESAYAQRLQSNVDRWGLGGCVRFAGALSPAGVRRHLAEASCLVLASFQENAPLVIAEAMASGVPVVACRVGGIPEMVEDGETGFIVASGEAAVFADRVAELLASPARREEFGRRARAIARQRYHPNVVADKTMAAYRAVSDAAWGRGARKPPCPD